MNLSPCMADLLRRLASMPLLDRLDLAAVSGWSRGAVYDAVARMQAGGLLASLPHATPLTPTTERFHLTAAGVRNLARDTGTRVERLLAAWPVSNQWRRILLERLDGVACLYRFAAALSDAAYPIRFRWYRGLALDAGMRLPDGRTLGVVRQGRTTDRTGFAKRLWRLRDGPRPSALFVLVPDEVRLRQVRRLLPRLRLRAFLALERDVACAGPDDRVWRLPSAGAVNLRSAIASVEESEALPREEPLRRAALPEPIATPGAEEGTPGWLLPSDLSAPEKHALDVLADWSWIGRGDLAGVMGVSPNRLTQILGRLIALRLAACTPGGRYVLADRGLGYLARRDRTAVGTARQRWSAPVSSHKTTPRWTDVPGRRSRQLLRNAPAHRRGPRLRGSAGPAGPRRRLAAGATGPAAPGIPVLPSRGVPSLGAPRRLRRGAERLGRMALLPRVGAPSRAACHHDRPARTIPALLRHPPPPRRPRHAALRPRRSP